MVQFSFLSFVYRILPSINEQTSLNIIIINIFHVILRGVKIGDRHTTLANVSQLRRFKNINGLLRMNEGLSKSNNRNQLAIMVVAVLVLVPNTQLGTLVPSTPRKAR